MKKQLLNTFKLRTLLLATILCTVFTGRAWGAEEVYKTALFGSSYNSKGVSSYADSWTSTNDGFTVDLANFNNNNHAWAYIKCGSKNFASVATIITDAAIDKAVTKVSVTIDAITTANVNSIKLYTSNDKSTWTDAGSFTAAKGVQEVSLASPAANLFYKVEFDCKKASNGCVQVSKVEYYYDNAGGGETPSLTESNLALTGAPIALSFDLYTNPTAQVIHYTTSSNGAVTVSKSDYVETVVDEDEKTITVTPVKETPSAQTITVTQAADDTYKAGTVEFTVSVANSAPYVQPTEFDIALNNALFGTNYNGSVSNITDESPLVGSQDHVTVTYAGGGNHYVNNSQIRFYPSNKLTFEAPSGYKIKTIVFTEDGTWAATITADSGEYTDESKTWEGDASSVVFTGSGASHCRMMKAAITLAVPSPLASIAVTGAPTTFHLGDDFSHEGAVVTATYENETTKDVTTSATFSTPDMTTVGEKTVTVSYSEGGETKTADYTITVNAPAVLTGITLSGEYPTVFNVGDAFSHEGMIVTASYDDDTTKDVADEATFTGYDMSAVGEQTVTVSYNDKTATYKITLSLRPGSEALPYTVDQAIEAIDNPGDVSGVYATGIVSEIVTEYSAQHGNISYNISADGTTAGNQLQAYRGKSYNGDNFTSEDDIQVGDKVVIYGNLQKYGTTYEFAANNQLVSLERVSLPEVSITGAANATWVAPAKVKITSDDVKVYTVTYDDAVGCTRKHEVADKVVPANGVVLLTSDDATTVTLVNTADEATDFAALENDLLGSDGTVQGAANIFCLAVGEKGLGFYPVDSSIKVPAGKAYLLIPATQAAPSYLWFNDDTTAIDSLTTDTAAGNESGEIYSLTGQRVGKNYRGIVIMNGRKVLKK